MRDDLIHFLETLNTDLNGTLLNVDIPSYVDKIQNSATIVSISKKGRIIAFIAFYENDKTREMAYLTLIAVSKDYLHLGYGKRLLELSINQIQENGFKFYRLEVKEDNFKAITLYEKYGFIRKALVHGTVIMEKQL